MSSLRTCLLLLLHSLILQIVPGPRDAAQGRTVTMLLVFTPPFEYAAGTLHKHSGSMLGLVHSRNSPPACSGSMQLEVAFSSCVDICSRERPQSPGLGIALDPELGPFSLYVRVCE